MELVVRFRPLTLALFEATCLAAGADVDDVLFGQEEIPGEAAQAVSPGLLVEHSDVPEEILADAAAPLVQAFVMACREEAQDAFAAAAFYADRCGVPLGGGEGSGISMARLCVREGAAGWQVLRAMPIGEALLYLLLRGVDASAERPLSGD